MFDEPSSQTASLGNAVQNSQLNTRPFQFAIEALRKAIVDAGCRLFHELDVQIPSKDAGRSSDGAYLMFYFHPDWMTEIMQSGWAGLLEAPLKLAVIRQPDGSALICWADPAIALARYQHPVLTALGPEMARMTRIIVDGSLEPQAS